MHLREAVFLHCMMKTENLYVYMYIHRKKTSVLLIIPLFLSNLALYWFTAVGSETLFYSNKYYRRPDWLFPRSYCYFPPKPPDTPDPSAISRQNLCCHVINLQALFPFHCQSALNM